ncbi:MBL fold metallo-hydrolase [Pseudogracilibacillus auburnensis]|uniref:Ribonuclease Z n=1 Tax=Pseudogracilibacillus auburnensis TaxID=1494959 RepID=A0A2V3VNE7_9BACI|nr:MBL fold metallo-hydrolase [Pseudogracilibacillus auburnensis]PXW82328.1 ribonuclease Z [Pseudogracilibacillus auburnensis]
MATIHFLGTGSAYPSSERDNTSILFSFEDKHFLVDVSGNPAKRLKELNKSLREIDTLLITHTHIDHIFGLPSLLWGMWLEDRTEPFTIYVDYRNENQLHTWLDTISIKEWDIRFDIQINTFNGAEVSELFVCNDLQLFSIPAIHSVPTVGFEFIYKAKRIVYSADTAINELIKEYNYIDLLIHEATFASKNSTFHSSMEEVLTYYPLDQIEKLIFVHLSENEPYNEVYDKLVNDNKKSSIKIAYDQMKISL